MIFNLNRKKPKYEIAHDNLNDIWLLYDLSNKKYKFYSRINIEALQTVKNDRLKRLNLK